MTVTPSEDTGAMSNRVTPPESGRRRFDGESDYDRQVFSAAGKRKTSYGLSEDAFWALVRGQDFACAICTVRFHAGGPTMAVDHNHDTGEVRGVLCTRCNSGLGWFGDSPDRLRRALRYLSERGCYGDDKTGA